MAEKKPKKYVVKYFETIDKSSISQMENILNGAADVGYKISKTHLDQDSGDFWVILELEEKGSQ